MPRLARSALWAPLLCAALLTLACDDDDSGGSGDEPDAGVEGDWYHPRAGVSWQWQLEGEVNASYDVEIYDVDLFDAPEALIDDLHAEGRKVICYFSAGSFEAWREDADQFEEATLGEPLEGWDERWLDVRAPSVLSIMEARLERAARKGCDGVEPDNVDGYINASGFDLTSEDQLAYNRALARAAHARGLAVGLKNDLDQIPALVDLFDFAVNEQCFEFDECEATRPFIAQDKPVLNAEYLERYVEDESARAEICEASSEAELSTLVLPLELDDSFRLSCGD